MVLPPLELFSLRKELPCCRAALSVFWRLFAASETKNRPTVSRGPVFRQIQPCAISVACARPCFWAAQTAVGAQDVVLGVQRYVEALAAVAAQGVIAAPGGTVAQVGSAVLDGTAVPGCFVAPGGTAVRYGSEAAGRSSRSNGSHAGDCLRPDCPDAVAAGTAALIGALASCRAWVAGGRVRSCCRGPGCSDHRSSESRAEDFPRPDCPDGAAVQTAVSSWAH